MIRFYGVCGAYWELKHFKRIKSLSENIWHQNPRFNMSPSRKTNIEQQRWQGRILVVKICLLWILLVITTVSGLQNNSGRIQRCSNFFSRPSSAQPKRFMRSIRSTIQKHLYPTSTYCISPKKTCWSKKVSRLFWWTCPQFSDLERLAFSPRLKNRSFKFKSIIPQLPNTQISHHATAFCSNRRFRVMADFLHRESQRLWKETQVPILDHFWVAPMVLDLSRDANAFRRPLFPLGHPAASLTFVAVDSEERMESFCNIKLRKGTKVEEAMKAARRSMIQSPPFYLSFLAYSYAPIHYLRKLLK